MESEHLRIEIARLRGTIALNEEELTILDDQVATYSREVVALRFALNRAKSASSVIALAAETDPSKQQYAAEALAYLAESWSLGRTPAEEMEFSIVALHHRRALANSAAAFEMWANLIDVPLSALVAYHESGIKAEDVSNLIQASGLGAIAVRVK